MTSTTAAVPTTPRQVESCSGQWNVQVVRGKVTTRCLWNACKALAIGLFLMTVGTTMAIVGYYADQLSIRNEVRGNTTVRIKNESRGFHLNNLSYAGPIIMGVGGFIVVAACVMTFEARDSAAKVVPARFKANSSVQLSSSSKATLQTLRSIQRYENRMNMSCQTPMRKTRSGHRGRRSPISDPLRRKLLTTSFIQFSRAMDEAALSGWKLNPKKLSEANMNKSPSAPNLTGPGKPAASPGRRVTSQEGAKKMLKRSSPRPGARLDPSRIPERCTLLSPRLLQRQALSIDNPFLENQAGRSPPSPGICHQCSSKSAESRDSLHMELGASAGVSGSQGSMALDLHDYQVTLSIKDESQTRRSDMSRRHQLLRQRPVEDEKESCRCMHTGHVVTFAPEDSIRLLNTPRFHGDPVVQRDFSRSRSYTDDKGERRVYCVEDHERKFLSADYVNRCPCVSPARRHRCRIDPRCVAHNAALVRKNAKRRKSTQKNDRSLSNEDSSKSHTPKSPAASPSGRGTPSPSPLGGSPRAS